MQLGMQVQQCNRCHVISCSSISFGQSTAINALTNLDIIMRPIFIHFGCLGMVFFDAN